MAQYHVQDVKTAPHESIQCLDGNGPNLHHANTAPVARSKLEKLGTYNIVVLVLGTVFIILPIAFLAFVWSVSINQYLSGHQSRLWILIVANDWTARVVTLSTVLMRAAIAAQLCVFAAIMAALILERAGTYTSDFPLLSMIRCANNGPQALIWHVFHTITTTTGSQLGYSIVIIIAILNAIALQFTSTILLADFDVVDVILGQEKGTIWWGNSDDSVTTVLQSSNYWKSGSTTMPAFAEYSEAGSHGFDYSDTGKTYRGFLPFYNTTSRENTRSYEGPMIVVDERIICTKPNMSEVTAYYGDDFLLGGTIDITNAHPDVIVLNSSRNSIKFNCSLPELDHSISDGNSTMFLTAALCNVWGPPFWIKDGILGNNLPTRADNGSWYVSDYEVEVGSMWLFMDMSAPGQNSSWAPSRSDRNLTVLPRLDSPDGPWTQFGRDGKNVSLSACYWSPQTDNFEVTAWNEFGTTTESDVIFWDSGSQEFNTSLARILLNAATPQEFKDWDVPNTKPESRGLLTLWNNANWTANLTSYKYGITSSSYLDSQISKEFFEDTNDNLDPTYQLSPVDGGDYNSIHGLHVALAQAVLQKTNDPARALQALTHTILQEIYYEWLPSYDLNATVTLTAVESHTIPVEWVHFGIVMGLVGLHVLLVVIAVALFLTRTEMSLLGNAWQVVAQVHSSDTAHAVGKGYMATDKELEASARSNGIARERIRIARADNGRHEAVMAARNR